MRLPDSGRYPHPRIRSSSWRHFELDQHEPGWGMCRVSGEVVSTAPAAITVIPPVVKSPTARAARFVNGEAMGLWNSAVPTDQSRDVVEGNWTASVLFRLMVRPTLPEEFTLFGLTGVAGIDTAIENYLMAIQLTTAGRPRMFWENGAGVNVATDATDFIVEPYEWVLLTWQKSGYTAAGPGGTGNLRLFIWGQQVESFATVANCSDGGNAFWKIGSEEFTGGITDNEATADIAGAYLWAEPLTPEQIADDARRVRAQLFANHVDMRVAVASAPGIEPDVDLTDLEGMDWVDSVSISDEVDKAVMTATVVCLTEQEHLSLSPLKTESKLNLLDLFDPTSYLPLLDLARRIDIFAARVPLGLRGADEDWFSVFSGFIDEFDEGGSETISLNCRDLGADLIETFIEEEITYGAPVPGSAIEGEMQFILNDNDNDPTNDSVVGLIPRAASYDPIVLYTPVSPNFTLVEDDQRRENVLSALRQKAGLIAWECRYMFDQNPNENRWRLTFFEPRRVRGDIGDVDAVIAPDDILNITSLKRSVFGIRTSARVVYPSSEPGPTAPTYAGSLPTGFFIEGQDWQDLDGEGGRLMAYIQIRNTNAEARINRRAFMEFAEASTSQIDTIQEAGDLCIGSLQDTGEEDLGKAYSIPLMPEMERNDMIRFNPNPQRFTVAQSLAVKGYTHTWSASGEGTSQVQVRGRPSAGFKRWLRLETRGAGRAGAITPFETLSDQHTTAISTAIRSILDQTSYLTGGKFLAVRNPNFQFYSAGLENEPDGWTLVGGTWGGTSGAGPRTETALSQSGGYSINLDTSDVGILTSDPIPLEATEYTSLGLEVVWRRSASGGVPRVTLRFFDENMAPIEPLGSTHSNRALHPTELQPHWTAANVGEGRFVSVSEVLAGPTVRLTTSPVEAATVYNIGDVVDYVGRQDRSSHNVRRGEVTARDNGGGGGAARYTITPNDEVPVASGGTSDDGAVGWRPPYWQADASTTVHPINTWITSRQIGIEPPTTEAKFVAIELEAVNVSGFADVFYDQVQLYKIGRQMRLGVVSPSTQQYSENLWLHIRHTLAHPGPRGATTSPDTLPAGGFDYGDNYANDGFPSATVSQGPHYLVKEPGLLDVTIRFHADANGTGRCRLRLVKNMNYNNSNNASLGGGTVLAYGEWVDNSNQLGLPAADEIANSLTTRVPVEPGDRVNAEVYVEADTGTVFSVLQLPELNFSFFKQEVAD